MPFCHECGNPVGATQKFCRECGTKQEIPEISAQKLPSKRPKHDHVPAAGSEPRTNHQPQGSRYKVKEEAVLMDVSSRVVSVTHRTQVEEEAVLMDVEPPIVSATHGLHTAVPKNVTRIKIEPGQSQFRKDNTSEAEGTRNVSKEVGVKVECPAVQRKLEAKKCASGETIHVKGTKTRC